MSDERRGAALRLGLLCVFGVGCSGASGFVSLRLGPERELPRSCEMRRQWLRDGEKGTDHRGIQETVLCLVINQWSHQGASMLPTS